MYKLLLLVVFLPVISFSQSMTAWVHNADKFYANADYFNALKLYQLAQNDSLVKKENVLPYEIELTSQKLTDKGIQLDSTRVIPMNQYVNHQIGMCHFYLHNYQLAEQSFKISAALPFYTTDKFNYARAIKNNEDYRLAATLFEEYILAYPTDSLASIAKMELEGCNFALQNHTENWNAQVKMADTSVFNRGTVSMATMFFGRQNRLMFSSARTGGVILKPEQNSELLFDIYWTERSNDSTWKPAINFGRPLNSASHDAAATISNNNVIYYTRWNDKFRKDQYIHLARMIDFKFYESYRLESPVNYPGKKSITPFVSADNRTLYFSSNRDGGFGGMDLWKISIDDQGRTIGVAVNLGPEINSPMDEICPFVHAHSNTLFFSSNGYNSIGGFDVFKAGFSSESAKYTSPMNLGKSINSGKDDVNFIIDSLMLNGFLTSDRTSIDNVYPSKIFEFKNDQIMIVSIGHVTGVDGKPIAKAKVELKDVSGTLSPINLVTDANGKFTTNLPFGYEFYIETQMQGFIPNAINFSTKNYTTAQTVVLEKIQMEKK
jgi:tetratricopeptide (TPR) repeat protein